jgi:hypothetical protein
MEDMGANPCASRTRTCNRHGCGLRTWDACGLAHGTRAAPHMGRVRPRTWDACGFTDGTAGNPQTARLRTPNRHGCGLPTGTVEDSQPARLRTLNRLGIDLNPNMELTSILC